jgi:dihydroneopterin aldolase
VTADRLLLSGMAFFGRHGVLVGERREGQWFVVDVEIDTRTAQAGARRDDLAATVDYREVYGAVRTIIEGRSVRLLETLADAIARRLLQIRRIEGVTVRVRKPAVPLPGPVGAAGIEIVRRKARLARLNRRPRRKPAP